MSYIILVNSYVRLLNDHTFFFEYLVSNELNSQYFIEPKNAMQLAMLDDR